MTRTAGSIAYIEKLKDPRWQRKRLEIFERDKWTCQSCGDTQSTLHAHHRMYIKGREPWDYPNKLLVTLCETCHEVETGVLQAEVDDLIMVLHERGFLSSDFLQLKTAFGLMSESIAENGPRKAADIICWALQDTEMSRAIVARFNELEAGVVFGGEEEEGAAPILPGGSTQL